MGFDVLHLLCPAAVIHAERFEATIAGDLIEAGLREQKQCACGRFFEPEFDKCGRLFRVVFVLIDRIGMPCERKKPFGFHFLHDGLPFKVLIAGVGDVAAGNFAGHEWAVEFHAEPLAEFAVVGEGTPDAGDRSFEFDTLFDAVIFHMQPPGCILMRYWRKSNLVVAYCQRLRGILARTADPSAFGPQDDSVNLLTASERVFVAYFSGELAQKRGTEGHAPEKKSLKVSRHNSSDS